MSQTITELTQTHSVILPYNGLCELLAYTPDGVCYFELFYDEEWVAYFKVWEDGTLETLADELSGKRQITYPALPVGACVPPSSPSPLPHFRLCLTGGNRLEERVDEVAVSLTLPQKQWLAQRLSSIGVAWNIIGLLENSIISACEFAGLMWGVRRLSVAYVDPHHPSQYCTATLQTFERLQPFTVWDRSMLPEQEVLVGVVNDPLACYSTMHGIIVIDQLADVSRRVRLVYAQVGTVL